MLQEMLIILLECSLSMSVLILLLLALIPWLSRRYAAKWLYCTWLVIALGLLVPFRFHPAAPLIKMSVVPSSFQRIIAEIPENSAGLPVAAGTPVHHHVSALSLPQLLFLLWSAGSVVFLLKNIWKHHRFLAMVRRWGKEVKDPETLNLLSRIKEEMGIAGQVDLLICPCVTSPMMIGFYHPAVLLPRVNFSPHELSLVLRHELVHLKRRDLWYKCLVLLATALHWFNPLVYLMGREIDTWCEISCDAEVVKGENLEERQCYSATILRVAGGRASFPTVLSTSLTGGKRALRNRLRFILGSTARKRTGILLLCLVLLGTLGTGMIFTVPGKAVADGTVSPAMLAAARSFAEQAEAAANHHMTQDPVITVMSDQVKSGTREVVLNIDAMDVLNSGAIDEQPVLAGKLQYLKEHNTSLSASAKKAVTDDITDWRSTLQSAMKTPTETCYVIKVIAGTDGTDTSASGAFQVFVDNGVTGADYIPADQFLQGLRSIRITAAQAYDSVTSTVASSIKQSSAVVPATSAYFPSQAYTYADTWVANTTATCSDGTTLQNTANWNNSEFPNYLYRECNDCADFVSQCLNAGYVPETSTWNYYTAGHPATAWCNVGSLKDYLVSNGIIAYNVGVSNCKCGDPFFFAQGGTLVHTVFMVYNDGSNFKYDAHTNDRKRLAWTGTLSGYTYYYAHVIY